MFRDIKIVINTNTVKKKFNPLVEVHIETPEECSS